MRYGYGYFEEDHLGQVADTGLWRRVIAYSWPHRRKLAVAILLSFVITAASLALPYMIRLGIDSYIVNTQLETAERVSGLAGLAWLFVGAVIVGFAANFFQVVILEWTGQTIMHQMRQQLFRHMMGLDISFFNNNPKGKLVTRLTNDIQNMHEMFTSVIVTLFNDSIKLIGILGILFWMNWRLALLLSLLLPLIAGNTLWFSRLARDAFRTIRTHVARINASLQESISGISVIQLFLRETDTAAKFADLNNAYLRSNLYQIKIFAIFMPAIELFSAIATGCIIWYGGGEVIRDNLTIGELAAFIAYMRLFFQPIRELSQKYSIVQSALASAERIFQLLDISPAISPVEPQKGKADMQGAVVFRGVCFGYDAEQEILHDVSFSVSPGQTLAIVGATGAGKSTIVNLLERFYEPDSGDILIDGQDLRSLDTGWLRRQVGLVMQDIFIIPGSIRENILLDREMDDDALGEIIAKSQLRNLIRQLPDGLETRIGDGGVDLSSGQKQLLTFARVLARNPKLLILDEATSSVDSATEMLIDRAVQSTLANRTSIVIAHRLSTIRSADTILVMDQGEIVERGSHTGLISKGGLYTHLHNLQLARSREDISS
ncbi:MAG: ABC transporter ATP-binding protein [Desulfobulbaceae bacterium]|uniref:ABC transporter ATP-binding protein n=1 Tax=Candidatus Desulfobia pelagia TaxID=2841692 RepID=A0A8J6ND78_9BACT|nr:ABC transporter ATP-binding protein [Candidatus Desulfobia pelagia]